MGVIHTLQRTDSPTICAARIVAGDPFTPRLTQEDVSPPRSHDDRVAFPQPNAAWLAPCLETFQACAESV
jgi:hypothetical protein